jgi:hypothetical protein
LPFFVGLLRIPLLSSALINLFSPQMQARAILRYCYFDSDLITKEQITEYASHLQKTRYGKLSLRQHGQSISNVYLNI